MFRRQSPRSSCPYSLDDKRTELPKDQNDLPDLLKRWRERDPRKESDRSAQHFFVPLAEIEKNSFDLSVNRYRVVKHEELEYDSPKAILKDLKKLEKEIQDGIEDLEELLK